MALASRDLPVRIRVYRPTDHSSIQELVKQYLYSTGSPARIAFVDVFSRPSTYMFYVVLVLAISATIVGEAHSPYLGVSVASSILIYFAILFNGKVACYRRWAYSGWNSDFTQFGLLESYGLAPSQELDGDYIPVGPQCFWVAEVNVPGEGLPQVAGCIGFASPIRIPGINPEGKHGEMRRLMVSPEYRCLGIAQKLITACEERAKEFGLASIVLGTSEYHPHARRLYQRNGYSVFEELNWPSGLMMSVRVFLYRKYLEA